MARKRASLNNIPVSAPGIAFTVEPSVQQRFENASKEKAPNLQKN